MEIEDVKKEVIKILRDELLKDGLSGSRFSAFFFGSRVTGTNTTTSDLDVGIEGTTAVPENTMRSIRSRCAALPTLYTVDVVDFFLLNEDFKKVAKEKTEKIV